MNYRKLGYKRKDNSFKKILGIVMLIAGAFLGLYVGVWVCFIGGIVDIIHQVQAEYAQAAPIAWGICKIVFASFFGWVAGLVLMLPGWYMVVGDS